MMKMNKKGFTIVELVIVIAVIAILAAVMIPTFSGIVTKANESAVLQAARSYYSEVYADDIADGINDGKVKATNAVTCPAGCTYTTVGSVLTFKYVDTTKKIAAEYTVDGGWVVRAATQAELTPAT